ncbi:hypothetical protein [Piscinibacter sakaiensis]|uniref:hypothetical protein n=1 Tax=Piscinibacter sakaiensis TaxID=1547922 RepID=UPI003AAB2571
MEKDELSAPSQSENCKRRPLAGAPLRAAHNQAASELSPSGIHWEALDEDIPLYVPSLCMSQFPIAEDRKDCRGVDMA